MKSWIIKMQINNHNSWLEWNFFLKVLQGLHYLLFCRVLLSPITLRSVNGHRPDTKREHYQTAALAGALGVGNVFGGISCYQLEFPSFFLFFNTP